MGGREGGREDAAADRHISKGVAAGWPQSLLPGLSRSLSQARRLLVGLLALTTGTSFGGGGGGTAYLFFR